MDYNLILYIGLFLIVGGFSLWLYSEHKLREIDIQLFKPNQKIEELKMSDEEIKTLYNIVDKLEKRIFLLEKVLASHAKCIGEMREEKKDE